MRGRVRPGLSAIAPRHRFRLRSLARRSPDRARRRAGGKVAAAEREIRLDPGGTVEVLTRIFAAAGGSAEEARAIAVSLVEANLAGHDSHGIVRTQRYCLWAREGNVRFGQRMDVVSDAPGFALLDAQHGFGQTAGAEAVRIGVEKAKAQGFSVDRSAPVGASRAHRRLGRDGLRRGAGLDPLRQCRALAAGCAFRRRRAAHGDRPCRYRRAV